MDDNARLKLQQMIQTNNVSDQTGLILRTDVQTMIRLKQQFNNDTYLLNETAQKECYFLFFNYTDIYNKIKKDDIDLTILFQFLDVLQKIENNEIDQHEGSFEVGTLLKKIYVDSALKKAKKLNENVQETVHRFGSSITWKQFKNRVI